MKNPAGLLLTGERKVYEEQEKKGPSAPILGNLGKSKRGGRRHFLALIPQTWGGGASFWRIS
jgi:hypothetical protein